MCNGVLNYPFILRNAGIFYKIASFATGKTAIDAVLNRTFGSVYSGGRNIE